MCMTACLYTFLFMKIFFQASWDIPKTSFFFETLPGHCRNFSQQILNLLHFSPQGIYHLLYYKTVCTVDFFSSNVPEPIRTEFIWIHLCTRFCDWEVHRSLSTCSTIFHNDSSLGIFSVLF